MKNTMGKRVDEEREEKSKNRFTIRKPSRQATQQNDDFCIEEICSFFLMGPSTPAHYSLAMTLAHCYYLPPPAPLPLHATTQARLTPLIV
jgi:hypothetical protein